MTRISVIGGPGTGKTSSAARAAVILQVTHVELDALWWAPRWTPVDLEAFQDRVRQAARGDSWVIEGYSLEEAVRSEIWPRADAIVWLDLPRWLAVSRAIRRSALRVLRRTDLWGTNRQTARVLAPCSIVRFVRRWPAYSAAIDAAVANEPLDGKDVVRLRSDAQKDAWLAQLARNRSPGQRQVED